VPPIVSGHRRRGEENDSGFRIRHPRHHETHLRENIGKVDEPQSKAVFEISAEAPADPIKAFGNHEKKNEAARRR